MPLDAALPTAGPTDISAAYGKEIDLAEAAKLLGRGPVWAGTSLHGLRSIPSSS